MKNKAKILSMLAMALLSGYADTKLLPNILFIAVDDLRPILGCYGNEQVQSPNIDHIASEGIVFDRAYCQQAVCTPSRVSLMTGAHPDTLGIYGSGRGIKEWRDVRKGFVSLSEQFRNEGWTAVGFGKIYDDRLGLDIGFSWDEFTPGWKPHFSIPENHAVEQRRWDEFKKNGRSKIKLPAVECADVPDETYTDGHITKLALDFLSKQDGNKPFFLAVGFPKPHLPFVAPKKYWDLYDRETLASASIQRPLPGFTEYTLSDYKEVYDYTVDRPVSEVAARELAHGYYACVSYVDAQIGRLIQALKTKGVYDNTMIVIWGDHGWKLGEYGEWAKHTNLEVDARVPLIFRSPNGEAGGIHSSSVVELTDVLPTVCSAANISVPESAEGVSLLPALKQPDMEFHDFALTQFPHRDAMGYSIRTKRWRYTEWRALDSGEIKARELYDLSKSPIELENVLLEKPDVAKEHAALLKKHLNQAPKWDGPGIF